MTEPVEDGSRTASLTIDGHEITVKELTEIQMMHLGRHAKILMRDDISKEAKLDSMETMLNILHSRIPDPEQLSFLIGLEEAGEVSLKDLTGMAKVFQEMGAANAPVTVARRRGRPRKSA